MHTCKRFGCLDDCHYDGLCFSCFMDRSLWRLRFDRMIEVFRDMAVDIKGYILAAEECGRGDGPEVRISKNLIEQFEKTIKPSKAKPDLKGFADAMLAISWDGCDADGAEIQGIAAAHNLIEERVMTEKCGDHCICAETGDFPQQCFRKRYLTEGASL